jgi:threonine aldolase
VIFRLKGEMTAKELVERLKVRGILASTLGPNMIRLVTHHDVDRNACIRAAEALTEELEVAAQIN